MLYLRISFQLPVVFNKNLGWLHFLSMQKACVWSLNLPKHAGIPHQTSTRTFHDSQAERINVKARLELDDSWLLFIHVHFPNRRIFARSFSTSLFFSRLVCLSIELWIMEESRRLKKFICYLLIDVILSIKQISLILWRKQCCYKEAARWFAKQNALKITRLLLSNVSTENEFFFIMECCNNVSESLYGGKFHSVSCNYACHHMTSESPLFHWQPEMPQTTVDSYARTNATEHWS